MATIATQLPTVAAPITPTYTAVTLTLWVLEQVAVPPTGAQAPAIPTGATKWSDALISSALGANASRIIVLDKSIISNFIDSTGFVNLKHNGVLTSITVAIFGPF